MGYHRQNSLIVFIFDLTRPPGPLQSGLQKRIISRIQPRHGLWGVIGIVLTSLSNLYDFFSFSTSPVPPGPLWSCPGSLPKGSFLEWDQNLGFGASLESPQRAGQNVLIFFDVTHVTPGPLWRVISWVGPRPGLSSKRARQIFFKIIWPHSSPQDPSEGSRQSLKRVTSKIEQKHGLLGINRIGSMHPSIF